MKGSFGLIVGIIIAIFLYLDAPKHNKSRWLWAILGFFFGPIALGIYFIRTGRKVLGWIITIVAILLYIIIIVSIIILVVALVATGGEF
ncbi:hypothetical protein BABA_15412 [Neobacillus bataviensis LMG 21833]|uniref:Cardiolipin synthase N-terminal domain-containing protein n=1 Tax=Neobacillus bataviensis LMG 21833 TaxID=1117379 RepID=K6C5Y8_9BACI|nr:hypothetical protein [Neobacillus bataviensis]EKN66510.1 hypothetical protein BABA_15412 [Neobacillus bataviensis LMG 21833]